MLTGAPPPASELATLQEIPFRVRKEVCDHSVPGTRVVPIRKEAIMATPTETQGVIRSLIPARIDRLPWSPFHTRLVIALGVAWILDGLEITVASAVADTLTQPETLALSSAAVGRVATAHLAGEVVGALLFVRLSDKLGRRKLFMIHL